MKPVIDHIQIHRKDLKAAEPFYDKLMPILGFDLKRKIKGKVSAHDFDVVEYIHPLLIFGINSPRASYKEETVHRRRPGSVHHIAFKAGSQMEVDELYQKIKKAGPTSWTRRNSIPSTAKATMRFSLRTRWRKV